MSVFRAGGKKSSESIFPSIRPTLDLDFANSKTLDPRITFDRASGGSYVGADGLIKYAGVNEPRFDHDPVTGESLGLLIEESRTNLVTYSEQFNDASWVKVRSSVSANSVASPDGTSNADSLIEDTNPSTQHWQRQSITIVANTLYTATIFIKTNTRSSIRFGFLESTLTNGAYAHFNASTGVISSQTTAGTASSVSFSIDNFGSGWYRCRVSCIVDNSSTTGFMFIGIVDNSNNSSYTGDGTSGIYIWGAQLEQGSFPTSYIPTQGSTRTRSADDATITGKNFSDWYNQNEGSILWRGTIHSAPISGSRVFEIYNSSTSIERMAISVEGDGTMFIRVRKTNDTNTQTYGLGAVSYGSEYKISFGVDGSSLCITVNGEIKTTISDSFTLSPSDTLIFTDLRDVGGNRKFTTRHLNLSYYPKRLPDSQLIALTR